MKRTIYIALLWGLVVGQVFAQVKYQKPDHPFSRKLVFSVEGGATYAFTDFKSQKIDYLGRGSLEYFFPSTSVGAFGLKFFGGLGNIAGEGGYQSNATSQDFKSEIIFVGGGLTYALSLGKVVHPYIFVGASYLSYESKLGQSGDPNLLPTTELKDNAVNYNGEFGLRFLLSQVVSFNLSGMVHINPNDKLDGLRPRGDAKDLFYSASAGFSIYFSTSPKDSDEDGVVDSKDLCAETPIGVQVDEFGCPIDTDKDGVADYNDNCPDTPIDVPVDPNGCPFDNDADAVPDYLDKCPNTPQGVQVDASGCPVDTDKDGVADYIDQCPDTKAGVEVDQFGCEVVKEVKIEPEVKEVILSGKTTFAYGKAELLPAAKEELNAVIESIKENKSTRWRIEGHTDNKGSYAANKRMSKKRAKAVLDYFVSLGLAKERFETVGLGPDFPVTDNSTESGRALNRRVSIHYIDEDLTINETLDYDMTKDKIVENAIFSDGKYFVVQSSSWRSESKAQKEVSRLKGEGHKAFYVKVYIPQKQSDWYRVRVGYFKSLDQAREYKKSVK